jgi:putative ATPase
MACSQAFEYVGMPEGRFHLANAALYLATAPKSNSAMAFFDALETVEKEREAEVPTHLRDASRDKEGFGHGEGYLYPHAYRDHWVAQQYLPDALQGRVFYQPGGLGHEAKVKIEVERRREAQLAVMTEGGAGFGISEALTFTGELARGGRGVHDRDRWLQRAIGGAGERLAGLRDRVLDAAKLQRHHLVLDLNAGSGLLTWEALRRVPEGGVWALAAAVAEADALREIAARLPQVERPAILQGALAELPELLALRGEAAVRFDAIVGRGLVTAQHRAPNATRNTQYATRNQVLPQIAQLLAGFLRPGGVISLAEPIPRYTQRIYALVDLSSLGAALAAKVQAAEEAIYAVVDATVVDATTADDPLVNWAETDLAAAFRATGLAEVTVEPVEAVTEARITPALLDRWFTPAAPDARPAYVQRLTADGLSRLDADEVAAVEALYRRKLTGATVPWRSVTAYLVARR